MKAYSLQEHNGHPFHLLFYIHSSVSDKTHLHFNPYFYSFPEVFTIDLTSSA